MISLAGCFNRGDETETIIAVIERWYQAEREQDTNELTSLLHSRSVVEFISGERRPEPTGEEVQVTAQDLDADELAEYFIPPDVREIVADQENALVRAELTRDISKEEFWIVAKEEDGWGIVDTSLGQIPLPDIDSE